MSFHAVTAALKIKGLSPAEKFLLVDESLASYAKSPTWKLLENVAGAASQTIPACHADRNIRRLLLSLQAKNLIHRQARIVRGRQATRASDFITLYLTVVTPHVRWSAQKPIHYRTPRPPSSRTNRAKVSPLTPRPINL